MTGVKNRHCQKSRDRVLALVLLERFMSSSFLLQCCRIGGGLFTKKLNLHDGSEMGKERVIPVVGRWQMTALHPGNRPAFQWTKVTTKLRIIPLSNRIFGRAIVWGQHSEEENEEPFISKFNW